MNTEEMKKILVSNGNHIFSVVFTKKDGTKRRMVCRINVTKHLKGGLNTCEHIPKYLTVYDMANKGYRNINCETIKSIKMGGVEVHT